MVHRSIKCTTLRSKLPFIKASTGSTTLYTQSWPSTDYAPPPSHAKIRSASASNLDILIIRTARIMKIERTVKHEKKNIVSEEEILAT